ncbi:MAG: TIGR04219 family outer membrane beta-barrel protein [Pseudomonadales bacterium]
MKRACLALTLAVTCTAAQADFIGIYAGAGTWNADFSGDVISNVSLDSDLNLTGTNANHFYAAFEHPIPLIPNIRVARTAIDDSGTGALTSSFTFAGQTFTASQPVNSKLDLTHTDITLYYELVDIGFDLDVGITGRVFDGEVVVNTAREDLEGTLPMLYARTKIGLPFTGTYVNASINTIGSRHSDYTLAIGWETENFILPEFGIEAGYRNLSVDLDESDVDVVVDAKLDGVFINLTAHF